MLTLSLTEFWEPLRFGFSTPSGSLPAKPLIIPHWAFCNCLPFGLPSNYLPFDLLFWSFQVLLVFHNNYIFFKVCTLPISYKGKPEFLRLAKKTLPMLANLYLSPVPNLLPYPLSSPLINIMPFIHFSLIHEHETFSLALPFAMFYLFFSSFSVTSPLFTWQTCFQVLFKCHIYCEAFFRLAQRWILWSITFIFLSQ